MRGSFVLQPIGCDSMRYLFRLSHDSMKRARVQPNFEQGVGSVGVCRSRLRDRDVEQVEHWSEKLRERMASIVAMMPMFLTI